jgi:ribosomal protein S27E
MAEQTCPKCGSKIPTSEGWAKATVSLLIPAPAVPDMATQVRCPHCQHLFAEGEVRYLSSSDSRFSRVLAIIVVAVVLGYAVYQLLM